jgi:hypothetical protein
MTAKTKAKELIDYFKNFVDGEGMLDMYLAQQTCAVKVADEVLKNLPMYTGNINPLYQFWQEVREEIINAERLTALSNRA